MPSTISYDELVARLADGTIVLLDAQAPGWFEREHLPGAHRLDWDDIATSARGLIADPATPVAVYCWNTTCTGSEIAAAGLERLGYLAVYRYEGRKAGLIEYGGITVATPPSSPRAGCRSPTRRRSATATRDRRTPELRVDPLSGSGLNRSFRSISAAVPT